MPHLHDSFPRVYPSKQMIQASGVRLLTCAKNYHCVVIFTAFCILAVRAPLALADQTRPQAPTGLWEGSIQSRAGEVSFGIELTQQGSTVTAVLVNDTDRQPFSSVASTAVTVLPCCVSSMPKLTSPARDWMEPSHNPVGACGRVWSANAKGARTA